MSTDISIIIPVYNVEPYVADCIESVMAQIGVDDLGIECLIVDDRGTDRSMEVVRETLRDYSGEIDFRIIEREVNGGQSAARNSGIREAKGEYLFFLDSDDLITPDCLSVLWKQIILHPEVDSVYGQFSWLDEDGQIKPSVYYKNLGIPVYSADLKTVRQAYFKLPIVFWNRLIRREWIQSKDLYITEGIIYEDNEWSIRAYLHIGSYVFDEDATPTYLYRKRPNSTMTSSTQIQRDEYVLDVFCSVYEKLPVWDRNLMWYLLSHLLGIRSRIDSAKLSVDKFKQKIRSLSRSANCRPIHRFLLSYISLGRPYCRSRICRALNSLIQISQA